MVTHLASDEAVADARSQFPANGRSGVLGQWALRESLRRSRPISHPPPSDVAVHPRRPTSRISPGDRLWFRARRDGRK
jgi:hypothetical protein